MFSRQLVKNAMFDAARRLGVNSFLRTALRHRLLVLCYHGIIPDDCPADLRRTRVATRVSEFTRQLETLRRLFTPVSATDVLNHTRGDAELPPYSVLVTFDDGFHNNLKYAALELHRLGIPALINVATGHVGRSELLWTQELDERIISWRHPTLPMPHAQPDASLPDEAGERWQVAERVRGVCKHLPHEERVAYLDRLRQEPLIVPEAWQQYLYSFLSWEEVRELDGRGVSIGSHTVNHPILTTLSPSDLASELIESRSCIERELGKPCPWLAYPNGGPTDFSPQVVAAAKTAGYEVAFTLMGQTNPRSLNPLEIDRICISGELSDDAFHAHVNGFLAFLAR
jgi:peptidoglycan/xylan/chitin deacetylase (PgdA/CDA1 family)